MYDFVKLNFHKLHNLCWQRDFLQVEECQQTELELRWSKKIMIFDRFGVALCTVLPIMEASLREDIALQVMVYDWRE